MTFAILRLACVVLFSVLIPLLALTRFRYPTVPLWRLLALAVIVGWLLPFAYKSLLSPMIEQFDRDRMVAAAESMRNPPPPTGLSDGSIEVDNPFVIVDYLPEVYHPIGSLLYGPVYLACCLGAGWLFFRRSAIKDRLRIVLVSVGILFAACLALLGELIEIKPPRIFSDEVMIYGWNPFFGLQLFLPAAVILAWIIAAWVPRLIGRRAS